MYRAPLPEADVAILSGSFRAQHFLVTVRAEHQALYRRTFNHRPICAPWSYPLLAKPISLMTVHYPSVADQVHQRYPFFRSTFFERRMLFERDMAVPQFPCQSGAGALADGGRRVLS
jgi:hypothetical protein